MKNDLDSTLSALADPTRRLVVDLLADGPRRAGDLADAADLSGPAMSRHLRILRMSGLVEEERVERDARVRLYRLRPERLVALGAWLDQVQAFWTDQLASFKAHADIVGAETRAGVRPNGGKRNVEPKADVEHGRKAP